MFNDIRMIILWTCVLAAAVPALGQSAKPTFKPDQKVEVREGDQWSTATVVKQEGRKFQIRYEDGTEEWVTTDRLRTPGGAAGAPAAATTRPAADAPKKPKDVFKAGERVELKEGSSWSPGQIKNRDGDLYLVVFDGWESQFHWQWLHVSGVRKVGSDKPGPKYMRGVTIGNQGVAKAKEAAKREFANIEQVLAAEEAEAGGAKAGGQARGAFDPKPYDKPIAAPKLDKVRDLKLAAGPAKLAVFDPELAPKAKLAERSYVLKGPVDTWGNGPAALLVAGPRAVAVYTADAHGSDTRTASLELIDLVNGTHLGLVDADALSMPCGLSPSGQRLVGIQHGFFGDTRIRVDVHTLKGGAKPEHLISFIPFATEKQWKDVDVARFAGGGEDHLLTVSRGGTVILWDAPKATAIWRIKSEKHGGTAAISPGGKQVAVLDEGALVLLDALSGKVLCRIPGQRSVRELTFTPDGKRIVGLSTSSVASWDLEQGKLMPDIALPAKAASEGLTPLDGRFILIGGTDVLDLDKKMVVWRYGSTARRPPRGGSPTVQSHGGRCWAVVTDDKRPVLTSAKLPHDRARKAADAVAVGQNLLLAPGGSVALSVAIEAPADQQQRITDAITAQLNQSGIKVDPNSPIKLNARTEQGKTTQQTYEVREFGRPFNRGTETVSVTEKITRVFVESDGKIAWESRTVSGGAPMMVHTKEGQTINDAVQAGSQFNVAFLESVRVPAYVPRPSETPWLGESTWGMSGVGNDKAIAQPNVPAPAAPANADGLE